MRPGDDPLDDFTREAFSAAGGSFDVFVSGQGPAVIVMPELPGLTPRVAAFARRVRALGCTVLAPSLFGVPGRAPSPGALLRSAAGACVAREFAAFATGRTAPVARWLRALAAEAHRRCGGPGVGVVGMCFTGGFALGAVVAPEVVAPVLCQPSLPLGLTAAMRASVGLGPEDLEAVRRRADAGLCALGLRFTNDPLVPAARFEALRRLLGERFIGVELDSSPGNAAGIRPRAHSVVTEDLVDEPGHPTRAALEQVLGFLGARLLPAPPGGQGAPR